MTSSDGARPLTGKIALVTGAGRGLGRAFAERLANLGADIAIHGMRENGPAEYGEGTTLTAVAEGVAADHGVRTIRVLALCLRTTMQTCASTCDVCSRRDMKSKLPRMAKPLWASRVCNITTWCCRT